MKTFLLPLVLVAACDSGPTETESILVFGTATQEMSIALDRATLGITSTSVDFSGACASGGTFSMTGTYNGQTTSEDRAAFDLATAFVNCGNNGTTLDGELHWTSVVAGQSFSASMVGELSAHGPNVDASCAFDVHMVVDRTLIGYSGSICGYDLNADLNIHTGT